MIVVDTNVLVYYYVKGDYTEGAVSVHARDPVWVAPFMWRSEFRNTMLLYLRRQLLSLAQIGRITRAAENRMQSYEFYTATSDVYRLAAASSCSAYDCEFVALAQELGIPLITADRRVLHEFPETAVDLAAFVGG